jgi:putative DNA primase/helicase
MTEQAETIPGLLPHHLKRLRTSGLSDATIKAAELYSETKPERLAALLHWSNPGKHLAPALVIPFVDAEGHNGFARVRPDTPRKVGGRIAKYESPRGESIRIYLPAGVARLLADPQAELIITEGELKALASTQAGFACIGLTGVDCWKQKRAERLLPELERVTWQGRKVFIVFDSDIVHKPQVELAECKLAKHLNDRGALVRCVRLPDGPIGDDGEPAKVGLDDFLVAHGNDGPAELRKLLDTAVEPEPLIGPDTKARAGSIEPASTAAEFLKERTTGLTPHLLYWRGGFYLWLDGRYLELEMGEVQAELIRSLNRNYVFLTTGIVANVLAQLKAQAALPSIMNSPAWLDNNVVTWRPSEILATRRELVHLPSVINGSEPYAIPATPKFFTQAALDYDFRINAPPPKLWLDFLNMLWPNDAASIATLAEWFGYCLTGDTSQQKILMIIGPPRSGKGTIARVLTSLIGQANVCGPTLASLEQNFGLSPLLGKSLAIIGDARLSGKSDQSKIVERLLSISGEDSLTVDRKFRDPVTGKIPARLMLISNELPRLAESSGSLANRMVLLRLTRSFLDAEDTKLTQKLLAELPSILLWALGGWRRLNDRGYFVQPESAKELAVEMLDLGSPISLFLKDCCVVGPTHSAAVDDVYVAWVAWCKDNGRDYPGTKQSLGRDLRAALPELKDSRPREAGSRFRRYEGIGLTT